MKRGDDVTGPHEAKDVVNYICIDDLIVRFREVVDLFQLIERLLYILFPWSIYELKKRGKTSIVIWSPRISYCTYLFDRETLTDRRDHLSSSLAAPFVYHCCRIRVIALVPRCR